MKTTLFVVLLALGTPGVATEAKTPTKPDFYACHPDGSVRIRGVYQMNAKGQVVKYSVFDGAGNLLHTEVPYYAEDGRIVRADWLDAQGRRQRAVIYFDNFLKVLNANGEVETGVFSQKEFLESAK